MPQRTGTGAGWGRSLYKQQRRLIYEKTVCNKRKAGRNRKRIPNPFHLYDEKGIRENVKELYDAFSWNKGYKEYFAVKATPNPFLINILHEYGCGCDCSSMTELMLSEALGIVGEDVMFHQMIHRRKSSARRLRWAASSIWTISRILKR